MRFSDVIHFDQCTLCIYSLLFNVTGLYCVRYLRFPCGLFYNSVSFWDQDAQHRQGKVGGRLIRILLEQSGLAVTAVLFRPSPETTKQSHGKLDLEQPVFRHKFERVTLQIHNLQLCYYFCLLYFLSLFECVLQNTLLFPTRIMHNEAYY